MSIKGANTTFWVFLFLIGQSWAGPPLPTHSAEDRRVLGLQHATRQLRSALNRRDVIEGHMRDMPGRYCAEHRMVGAEVDVAWAELIAAWESRYTSDAPGSARSQLLMAIANIKRQQQLDVDHHLTWAAWCAALPKVVQLPPPTEVETTEICPTLVTHGALIELRMDATRMRRAQSGFYLANRLTRAFADSWDFLFVLVEDGIKPGTADRASVFFDRNTPGIGGGGAFKKAHLPRWGSLRGVIVLDSDGLRGGPSLRGIVRAYANRLEIPGCSPGVVGGWGASDVGGQLGGGRSGTVRLITGDRWSIDGLVASKVGLVANGGNAVPYAPLELYLMGILPAEEVETVTFLRSARVLENGTFKATGTCKIDGSSLVEQFGARPRRVKPWTAGVVVVTTEPLTEQQVIAHRTRAEAFFHDGPDGDALILNVFEATGGRGTLNWIPPKIHRHPSCAALARPLP